ncbi:O-methyltransferase [Lachnospiraceae bacterium KM106-2]|nr:O-methyltransferase [Lachnospiraceae bacterium KM106-2]
MLKEVESVTAKVCAYARARHSYFDRNKIYDDYLAYDLLGKDEYENMRQLLVEENNQVDELISPIILPRIQYAESKLETFIQKEKEAQYVICGAGMDSYAFRNTHDDLEVFELDHPNTQNYKRKRIEELEWIIPLNAHFIPINFEYQTIKEVLLEADFNENKKSFFALLGVSYYLSLDTLSNTFNSMASIAKEGSYLVFDYPSPMKLAKEGKRIDHLREATEQMGEKMTEGFTYSQMKVELKKAGFEIVDHQNPRQIQEKYLANQNNKMKAYENVHFILARKEGFV